MGQKTQNGRILTFHVYMGQTTQNGRILTFHVYMGQITMLVMKFSYHELKTHILAPTSLTVSTFTQHGRRAEKQTISKTVLLVKPSFCIIS